MNKLKIDEPGLYSFYCPGCNHNHVIWTSECKTVYSNKKFFWDFNGSLQRPTFSPSLLNRTGSYADPLYEDDPEVPPTICHLFIKDGQIQYLADCTHFLAGRTITLRDVPSM